MIISVPREITPGERRVALTPDAAGKLVKGGAVVKVERGAGLEASFTDKAFEQAGATLEGDPASVWAADVVLTVQRPAVHPALGRSETELLRPGAILIGMLQPFGAPELFADLAGRKVTAFSLELLPRITRAQSMDVLSSMSTVAGYKAVLIAAAAAGRFLPMLVTAAGTVPPARVLVLGAGVAGLQAIATARRLGGVVQAFDVRPAVKEQVESLGAQFLAADAAVVAEGAGGYAKALSEDQHKRELELIHKHIVDADIVITTALIPGRPAPELITEAMLRDMKAGAIIVDLAAEAGGNCAVTKPGEEVVRDNVRVLGPVNLPSTMPTHASQMYARNMTSFLGLLVKNGSVQLDFEDQIIKDTCLTHDGVITHEPTRNRLGAVSKS